MRVASHLGISLQRCKREHTSTELLKWLAFLDKQELDHFNPIHHYLAQIALEIRRSYVRPKDRKRLKLEHFLLKFERKSNMDSSSKSKEEIAQEKLSNSKRHWLGLFGINPNKK